jgi:SWI/SNF-related matrix-associated actin-dependent regulator of chromatin subfamily A-like protein 1
MKITKRFVEERWNELYSWLKFGDTLYIAVSSYEEKDQVKQAGFRWQPDFKLWWTNDINRAAKLSEYADPSCKDELDAVRKTNFQSLQDSRAPNADFKVPCPEGLTYRPYQLAGIKYGSYHEGTLFGDEMGLGKTIEAIGIINFFSEIKKVLVICPSNRGTLKKKWNEELLKWLVRPFKIGIAESDFIPTPKTGYDITIINYDITFRHQEILRETIWDLIIIDEFHRLKGHSSERTVAIYGGKTKAMKTIEKKQKITLEPIKPIIALRKNGLSGTPIPNRVSELYPTLAYFVPEWKNKWRYFMSRYCGMTYSKYGADTSGSSNLSELQETLRTQCMIRRLKSQVATEIPTKTREIIKLNPDSNTKKLLSQEKENSKSHTIVYEELKARVEIAKASSEESYKDAIKNLRCAMQVSFEEGSKIRHELGLSKIKPTIEYLKELFEDTDKIAVFSWHRDVAKLLHEAFAEKSVLFIKDGDKAVESFQTDPNINLFVGSIATAEGYDLTAVEMILFIERSWVPKDMSQAEDRGHRIGLKNPLLIRHLVFDDSLDSKMAKILLEKQEMIDKALDIESSDEPICISEAPTTSKLNRVNIEKEAISITREEILEIHTKLRLLATMDADHANAINGVGFNKIDTYIGHSLANQMTLSAKQAILGRKITHKYSRQLETASW